MKKLILFIICISTLASCIEEVDLGIAADDEVLKILIVEATLTNELKNHTVALSRMDTLVDLGIDSVYNPYTPIRDINRDLVRYETNATVSIENSNAPPILLMRQVRVFMNLILNLLLKWAMHIN